MKTAGLHGVPNDEWAWPSQMLDGDHTITQPLPSPLHLVLHVIAGQDDTSVLPLAALVLADDPQELALLAGFPNHLQLHPTAAGGLELELQAHRAPRQVHRRADDPPVLAGLPAVTLHPQEIPVIWGNRPEQGFLVNARERHLFAAVAPTRESWDGRLGVFIYSCSCFLSPVSFQGSLEP